MDACSRRCYCIFPKFLPLSQQSCSPVACNDEKRDSEQIRSAFSHSDDLRRLATFSTLPKNLFSRDRARVRIERSSSSPSGRRSPEIRFAGTSSSSSSVGSTRGPGGASYLPRGAHTAPQGNWCSTSTIWESNYQALPTTPRRMRFCADIRWFRLHLLMGLGVVLTPGHH